MAYAVESKGTSPANALRDALDRAERQIVVLDAGNIENYLVLLDQIEQLLIDLADNQTDLRPERTRWESLLSRITNKPEPLASAAAKAGGMTKLRAQHPPADSFWWHVDVEVVRRRVQTVKRVGLTVGALVLVVALGLWTLNTFFPPSPEAVKMLNANSQIEQLVMEQKWQEALTVVEQTQQELPDEPELWLWETVLSEQIGDMARAQASLARVQEQMADRQALVWVQLGTLRLQIGNLEGAAAAGEQALAIDPNEPQATFLLGGVAEARNDMPTAIAMFDKTFALAEQDNPQLAVIARVRMGNLLQRAGSFDPGQSEPITATLTVTTTPTTP